MPVLSPRCVKPQRTVVVDARCYRIDFAVERDGVRVAIEIDGWDKSGTGTGQTRTEQQASTDRQNALVSDGWVPIRYTVSQVRRDPAAVARDLTARLRAVFAERPPPARSDVAAAPSRQADHRPPVGAVASQPPLSSSGTPRPPAAPNRSGWLPMAGAFAAIGVLVVGVLAVAGLATDNGGDGPSQPVSCSGFGIVRGNVSTSVVRH